MTRSGTGVSRSVVQRAEALLRSLIGVSQAAVLVRDTGGVERVRLVADGGLSNGQIVQNVRSAMLAALGVSLQPGQIEFVAAESWDAAVDDPTPSPAAELEIAPTSAKVLPEARSGHTEHAAPPNGRNGGNGANGRLGGNGKPKPPAAAGVAREAASPPVVANGHAAGLAAAAEHLATEGAGSTAPGRRTGPSEQYSTGGPARRKPRSRQQLPGLRASGRGAGRMPDTNLTEFEGAQFEVVIGTRSVRLERVETVRQGGRLRCRVVLMAGGDHFSAVADCADEPLAELQLSGRVTCDALRAGELTQTHFEAATVANLAGGMHVLVALRGWNRGEPIRRSGSAVIRDSAEEAAALAVLHALANT